MAKQTNEERLAVVETKIDIVITEQMKISNKLDELLPTVATTDQVSALRSEFDLKIKEIHSKRWIQNTLSAILGSILTFLLANFISNLT